MHRRRLLGVLAGASAALAGCLARQPAVGDDGEGANGDGFTVEEEHLEDCNEHATVAFVRSATELEAESTVGGMACTNES
ncbi:hypothetical protein [Halomarina ordinaria]|uniref:Secreted protein n=1 Tax=Halomarina ordinaria TaxID=3033939 RepID=A0ABD5UBK6_9EURY|nr:hypothetical protein [Halomarina sp. PSRA2]